MIRIEHLSKFYKKTNILALNDFSIDIKDKKIISILGPNGAGKTTLVKCICNIIIPDKGNVRFLDNDDLIGNLNSNIGVVFDGARSLYWSVTVLTNYKYLAALKGKSYKDIRNNIEEYTGLMKVEDLNNRVVRTLSTGQKQRVAIVAAMLHNPKLLILDEPSNGLDIDSKLDLAETIKMLKEKTDTTIIVTSHDIDFVKKFTDEFFIITKGVLGKTFINENLSTEEIEKLYREVSV